MKNATENTAAAEAMRELLVDASITEDIADMLVFGAERGLVDPADVPRLHNNWTAVTRFLEETGLQQAWDADQERRGVPIVCPDWCTVSHLDPGTHTRRLLGPWEGVVAHGADLAAGDQVSVDYNKDQMHPESDREPREYVAIWTRGDGPIELPPVDLTAAATDIASTLGRAVERLAEIQAGQEPAEAQKGEAIRQQMRHALYEVGRIDFAQMDDDQLFRLRDAAESLDNLASYFADFITTGVSE